ncbi:hypothetical protein E9F06_005175, partial [Escherichia coli]|nr:hypothetical protein [Escherichia coli]
MKQIKFRLSGDELKLAEHNAISSGFSSINTFARHNVLNIETKPVNIPVNNEPAKLVSVRLYPHEIELV